MAAKYVWCALALMVMAFGVEGTPAIHYDVNGEMGGDTKKVESPKTLLEKDGKISKVPVTVHVPNGTLESSSSTTQLPVTVTTQIVPTNLTSIEVEMENATVATTLPSTTVETTTKRPFNPMRIGLIGVRGKDLAAKLNVNTFPNSTGDCQWAGQAPFCDDWRYCPANYTEYREESSAYHFKDNAEEWDETFGASCWSRSKLFCCRIGTEDGTWAGKWRSTKTGRFMDCEYDGARAPCGTIKCTENGRVLTSGIGLNCVKVSLDGVSGTASPGEIDMNGYKYIKVGLPEI